MTLATDLANAIREEEELREALGHTEKKNKKHKKGQSSSDPVEALLERAACAARARARGKVCASVGPQAKGHPKARS